MNGYALHSFWAAEGALGHVDWEQKGELEVLVDVSLQIPCLCLFPLRVLSS